MKKILAFVLALLMLLSLAACGSKPEDAQTEENEPEQAEETQPEQGGETVEVQNEEDALIRNPEIDSVVEKFGNNMVRAGGVTTTDFSGTPTTEDKAEYLEDGRLQLTSSNLKVTFEIPFGWLVLTQDIVGQREDYEMYISNASAVVKIMQENHINAVALTTDNEELDMFVEESGYSKYIIDSNLITESNKDELVAILKQANPNCSDIYCVQIGERNFVIFEYEDMGLILFSAVVDSTEFMLAYQIKESTTQEQFDAVVEFLSKIEIEAVEQEENK